MGFRRLLADGTPFIWLSGGALAASLVLVAAMIALILWKGLGFFWPADLVQYDLKDGQAVLGRFEEREVTPDPDHPAAAKVFRIKIKQGNRDMGGHDFVWLSEADIVGSKTPEQAVVIERLEWGHFYGYIKEVKDHGKLVASGTPACYEYIDRRLQEVADRRERIRAIEKSDIGKVNYRQEKIRLKLKVLNKKGVTTGGEFDELERELKVLDAEYNGYSERLASLRAEQTGAVELQTIAGLAKTLPLDQIVRLYQPNRMGLLEKLGLYLSKVWEFLSDDPRESNTEGGVFPAIFGTVLMVMIMSLVVTPFGVLAAFYLREYARQGAFVSLVRIAVNNLAGVPSIVFGVFGVGFFIYFVGGGIDRLFFSESLPSPTYGTGGILWASLTLALLTVPVVIVSTEEGLAAIPKSMREGALALGATKFEAAKSVVLPSVMPSILTGLILAMARAAGEVAPLMITGVVKLAPSLPMDGFWPFIHLERKFMHLGFHLYDVGFQSPNVDAARPMVYTTTILLLFIVLLLNVGAIYIRNRLRKKYSAVGAAI